MAPPQSSRGAIGRLLSSSAARVLVLPLTGFATLASTRLVSENYGIDGYAIFALVASLPLLIPLSDLGLGAAVTNAAASLPDAGERFADTLAKARRVLFLVASSLAITVVSIALLGLWPALLGVPENGQTNLGVAIALCIYAVAIPGSLGARVLLGLRRNTTVVLIQGLTSPIGLLVIALVLVSDRDRSLSLLLPATVVGVLVTNWVCSGIASTAKPVRAAKRVTDAIPNERAVRAPVWDTALPMLVISLVLPITFQADRLILSWTSGLQELAAYSAAALVFLPVLSVVQVGGRSLWGEFAHARSKQINVHSTFLRVLATSGVIGGVGALGLLLLGPWLASWATSGIVEIPEQIFYLFAGQILVQALHLPGGMYLTDAAGLRFQAVTTSAMAVVALPLAIVLAGAFGAIGPPAATLFAMFACQFLPCLLRSLYLTKRQWS